MIVVTGGAGFIGSHLVDTLVERGHAVKVLDNLCRGRKQNLHPLASLHYTDLTGVLPYTLARHLRGADAVFHLAAKVTGIEYNRHNQMDMMQTNLQLNWNVAEAVRIAKPKLYVFVSTACVYPHNAPIPTPESAADACNPEPTNWGYGVAKWVGEQQAKFLFQEHGISTMTVRFFNASGPRDYYDPGTSHVVPALIHRAFNATDTLEVWGSGEQTRVFVDARDIAEVLVRLMDVDIASIAMPINIGHDWEVSIKQVAETINHLVTEGGLTVEFDKSKPDGYPRRAADTTRLNLLIGHYPWTPFETTVLDMVNDYTERFDVP